MRRLLLKDRIACCALAAFVLILLVTFAPSLAAPPALRAPDPDAPSVAEAAFSADQIHFFEQNVRPLLSARCFQCHGEKKQESSLRLDSRSGILAGGDNGAVIDLKSPAASKLIVAIGYQGDTQMPPDKKLADAEIAALRQWVEMGLPWPADSAAKPRSPSSDEAFAYARGHHWSFQPVKRPDVPLPPNASSVASTNSADAANVALSAQHVDLSAGPIDALVRAKLAGASIAPSPSAERRTLVRRLSYDLTGLPPSADVVDAFVTDESPDATARLVDQLLASPQYGERWGRHWMDVARYSDTRGYAFGRERRFAYAYTYRDYIIRALNADLPYDRFVTEQLAADRLDQGDDKRSLAALGFLTVGRHFDNQPDDMDERIDTVTRGLLGLTVGCARCHDHKFDPIPSEDYYSLYGVFASTTEPAELPVIGQPTELAAFNDYQAKLNTLQKAVDDYRNERQAALIDTMRKRTADYLEIVATKPASMFHDRAFAMSLRSEDLKPRLFERWRAYIAKRSKPDNAVFGPWQRLMALDEAKFAELAPAALAAIAAETKFNPLVRAALAAKPPKSRGELGRVYGDLLADVYAKMSDAKPLEGADELRKVLVGDEAPTIIPADQLRDYFNRAEKNKLSDLQKKIDAHQVSSRGAPPRAMMVVDAPKPFDPYVFIRGNQFRQGKKVPRQFLKILSSGDRKPFGAGSGRLDLAREITRSDNPLTPRVIANRLWMHHIGQPLVGTPSDFGLRSDPPTHPELLDYLASRLVEQGWSLKRLHREIVSSAAYQQSSEDRSEAAAIDPENRLVWRMNRRRLEFEALRDSLADAAGRLDERVGGPPEDLIKEPFTMRRAVYGFIDRQDLPNLLRVFDFASPDQSTAQRPQTTVPQQALFLMNSSFVEQQAKRLAERSEIRTANTPSAKIDALYRLLFGRMPTADEAQLGAAFIAQSGMQSEKAWPLYAQALLLSNEFTFVD